jgi:hypothetical protein
MDLPIKFPRETEVILEDVARFRALSPEERIRSIESLLADGAFLMSISPKAEWILQNEEEQRELKHKNIREFLARHATQEQAGDHSLASREKSRVAGAEVLRSPGVGRGKRTGASKTPPQPPGTDRVQLGSPFSACSSDRLHAR